MNHKLNIKIWLQILKSSILTLLLFASMAFANSEKSNLKSTGGGTKEDLNKQMLDLMMQTQRNIQVRQSVEGTLYNQLTGAEPPRYYMWRASDGSEGRNLPPDFHRSKRHIPYFLPPERLQAEMSLLNPEGLRSMHASLVQMALANPDFPNQKLIELLNGQYTMGQVAEDNSHLQVLCTYLSSFQASNQDGSSSTARSQSSFERQFLNSTIKRTQFLISAGYISNQNPVICKTSAGEEKEDNTVDLQELLQLRQRELQATSNPNNQNRGVTPVPQLTPVPGIETSRCSISQINKFVNAQKLRLNEAGTNHRIFFGFKEGNCHLNGELSKTAQNKIRLFIRPYHPGESSHTFIVDKVEDLSSKIMSIQFPELVADSTPPAARTPVNPPTTPQNRDSGPRCIGCNPFGSVR